jgi:hypothetical protein
MLDGAMVAPKRYLILLAAALTVGACYEATPFRVSVQSPPTALNCARTADRVFFDAAFERVSSVSGPDLFYRRRISGSGNVGLGWGIAVWMKGQSQQANGGRCEFELETLAADPGCGIQCPYSPQRGADFDDALKDMSHRLSLAFGEASPPK